MKRDIGSSPEAGAALGRNCYYPLSCTGRGEEKHHSSTSARSEKPVRGMKGRKMIGVYSGSPVFE